MFTLEERLEDLLGPSRSRGVNRDYPCVVHNEHHPSMSVNMETGLWYCHACGAKGNYEQLCNLFGATVDDEYRWLKAQRDADQSFHQPPDFRMVLADWNRVVYSGRQADSLSQTFARSRGIRPESLDAYGVLEKGSRLAFPYIDVDDKVTGIKYRDAAGNKYSEPGSEYGLYGVVLGVGRPNVIICEGESDTLRVHTELSDDSVGVVGTSGASVSQAQWTRFAVQFLFTRRIFLAYDADEAGDRCAETAMQVLGDGSARRLRPTRGKDMTDHLQAGGTLRECVT